MAGFPLVPGGAFSAKRDFSSVYDTCVLPLIRVRAQPQASKSVSRVCNVFHVTARALFLA